MGFEYGQKVVSSTGRLNTQKLRNYSPTTEDAVFCGNQVLTSCPIVTLLTQKKTRIPLNPHLSLC